MFDKIKDVYALQKMAKEIKKELKNIHIEAEVDGVIVIVDGEQEVVEVKFPEETTPHLPKLAEATKKAFNKAIKKSQQVAAETMNPVMRGLNLQGLRQ